MNTSDRQAFCEDKRNRKVGDYEGLRLRRGPAVRQKLA
jgi:hypothetical protein